MNSSSHVTVGVVGIDLGNSKVKFSLGRELTDGHILVDHFPSHSAQVEGREVLRQMPMMAPPDGTIVQVDALTFFAGKDVFKLCKLPPARPIDPSFITSPEYRALLYYALHLVAKHHDAATRMDIDMLVLGLPLSWLPTHRDTVKALAEQVHFVPGPQEGTLLEVHVNKAVVVGQPHGALISSAGAKRLAQGAQETMLVVDMGGGTTDWLTTTGMSVNPQRSGSTPIGTLACADAAAGALNQEYRHQPLVIEIVDNALRSSAKGVTLDARQFAMEQCWPRVDAELQKLVGQIKKSVGSFADIQSILLAGGGEPLLKRAMTAHMGRYENIFESDSNPLTSVVRGFHIIGEALVTQGRSVSQGDRRAE